MPMRRIDAPRRRATRGGARFDRSHLRPMLRRDGYAGMSDAYADLEQRPSLEVVPRRRVAANAAALVVVVLGVLMLSAVVLHTRLAERQLQIDRLERSVDNSRQLFEVLRQQRAELRSPTRLAAESQRLGMYPAPHTDFLSADPWSLAEILASAGTVSTFDGILIESDPLDQIRRVMAASTEGPD
jgi:hypothetical protein